METLWRTRGIGSLCSLRKGLRVWLLCSILLGHNSSFAYEVFLKIDGVLGESRDALHRDWIDADSVSHSIAGAFPTATSPTGRPSHQAISVLKRLDRSSPILLSAASNAKSSREATLEFLAPGLTARRFYSIRLKDVSIAAVTTSASSDQDFPTESVGIRYNHIEWIYSEFLAAGGTNNVTTYWDLIQNKGSGATVAGGELPLSTWLNVWFDADASPDQTADAADPDGDGLPNLLEYLLATVPTQMDVFPFVPRLEIRNEQRLLTLDFIQYRNRTGARVIPETSDDFNSWMQGGSVEEEIAADSDLKLVRILVPIDRQARFLRLRIDRN